MSTFPSILSSFTNPNSTDRLNSPSHSAIETSQNSGVSQLENVVGVEGSASTIGTFQYLVKSPASDGGGHIQTANRGGTGQTNYIKGDLLVGQGFSVLTKLALAGTDGLALVVDSTQATGIRWGVANNKPVIRIYSVASTSSVFTWPKPSNLSYIRVTVQAPGGAGASVLSNSQYSSGGAAGGWAVKNIAASLLSATERIDVGAGAVVSGAPASISSFGLTNPSASILANPGSNSGINILSTVGGTATGGDLNIQGGPGGSLGTTGTVGVSGDGGDSQLGHGGKGKLATNNGTGEPAVGYGAGGPGAARDASGNSTTAGPGTAGIVIVEEY